MIYNYVLDQQIVSTETVSYSKFSAERAKPFLLALVYTNRQMHTEMHLLPYNNFLFDFYRTATLNTWVSARTSAQLKTLRHINLSTFACHRFQGDCYTFSAQELACLAQMSGLNKIELSDTSSIFVSEASRMCCLSGWAEVVGRWPPGIVLYARDRDGKWEMTLDTGV